MAPARAPFVVVLTTVAEGLEGLAVESLVGPNPGVFLRLDLSYRHQCRLLGLD